MNMVGSPHHVPKALAVGVDALIAQGTEAGGHTGEVASSVLIPQCVDLCRGHLSPLHGGPVRMIRQRTPAEKFCWTCEPDFDFRPHSALLSCASEHTQRTGIWV
eukprot:SAG11_NODE_21707_length_420_cov_0.641745_1_plen_103_part_01